jgi:hypothetical protein
MTDSELTVKVCALLSSIDGWEWHPDGSPYAAADVAIAYGAIPATPDRAVGVRVYATEDDRVNHLSWRRVQLKHRGARGVPFGADDLAGESFAVLQGLSRHEGISDVSRLSMSPLGADGNGREERADNWIIILDNSEVLA